MKRKSFSDLEKDILDNILKVCAEESSSEPEAGSDLQRSELLEDLLEEPLPGGRIDQSSISKHLDSVCDISGLTDSVSLRELLFHPDTAISALHRTRKHGKILLRQARSPIQQDVATTLYYAAIASALVFHNERISRLSKDKLRQTLSTLSQATWLPSDLATLLKKALMCCRAPEE